MSVNKFYHIVLLGNVGTLITNTVSNCLFFFDWGQLPKSRWRVYITANLGTVNFNTNQQCLINVDLGQSEIELAKGYNGAYAGTSQQDKNIYVGCFTNPSNNGATNVFQINSTANPPIYLDATPNNNSFIHTLRNNLGPRTGFGPNMAVSRVILSMEQLDDPIPRSIKNSYQVVFNSSLGTMNNNMLGNYSFYYDWTTLPQGEYLVNMTFLTNNISVVDNRYAGNSIFIDLGQANNTVFFPSGQDNYNVVNKNFVGMLLFSGTNTLGQGASAPFYCNSYTTKPLYLRSRPTNNDVNVLILTDYKQQYILDMISTNDPLYNYTLCLTFNLIS